MRTFSQMLYVLICALILNLKNLLKCRKNYCLSKYYFNKPTELSSQNSIHRQHKNRKKPDWVIQEIIKIKAFNSQLGCRSVALIFNSRFESHKTRAETISKSYVANVIKQHRYEIQVLRRKIKSKPPHQIPFNKVWGMDLTFIDGTPIFGAVEHHSRKCLTLQLVKDKRSITLLRALLDILEKYPKPQYIRTGNESCFNSRLFRFGLWFLGIKKQTIDKHSPWQNGRIERFFGTFKSTIESLPENFKNEMELPYLLHSFQWWYNEIRLHQNLNGQTPNSVFNREQRQVARRE